MNRVILIGRLTADPDIKKGESTTVARYRLAVAREYNREETDFISCVAFGRAAEHAEKYYHKGIKIAVVGRIQTGSYQKQDGTTVYTTDVIVESQEFVESKAQSQDDGFIPVPQDIDGLFGE